MSKENVRIINLHNLLDYELGRFCSAEAELKKIIPHWISLAESMQLKIVLQKYLRHIEENLKNNEVFCVEEDIEFLPVVNRVIKAFIDDAEEKFSICSDSPVRDACLLSVIQSINHYKISMYGTANAFSVELGMEKYAAVFRESEVKEKQIDDRLSQLAGFEINLKAKTPVVLE